MRRLLLPLFGLLLATGACGGRGRTAPPPAPAPPPVAAERPAPPPATATAPDTVAPAPGDPAYAMPPAVQLPWRPPETGPSPEAQRVLDTLPEPAGIGLPPGLPRGKVTSTAAPPPRATAGICYEVQLLGVSNEGAARESAGRAEASLGVPVRVLSSHGLHRLRAGSCLDRGAAEALRDRARAAGYPEAFLAESAPR